MNPKPPTLLIYCLTLCAIAANPLTSPNLTEILDEFDKPVASAGFLLAAIPLAGIFLTPFIGLVADRHGRRLIITFCLLLFGVAGLASSLAQTYESLIAARLVQGVGSAGLLNLSLVLIADNWSGQERNTLLGRNAAALAVGLVLFPPVSGFLAEFTSWRYSLALTGLSVPLAFVALKTLARHTAGTTRSVGSHFQELRSVLRTPMVLATLASGCFLFVIIFGAYVTVIPIHLDQQYGFEAGARGAVLATPALGSIVAALCLGRISARVSRKSLIVISALLIGLSTFAIGGTTTLWILIVAAVIFGLGDGVLIPLFQAQAAESAHTDQTAAVLAMWTSAVRLGQLIGPLSAGLLLSVTSTSTVIMVGAVGFLALSAFWSWFRW